MSAKRPIFNFDGIKTAKLYPLVIALAAIVFTLYWASASGTNMTLGDLIFRFIAAIGISVNFGMSVWEVYADSKKSVLKKAKEEQVDQDLKVLLEHKETTTAFIADTTVKLATLQAQLEATSTGLAKLKLTVDNHREPSVPQPV